MTRLFYFPTAVGVFYLCKDKKGAYLTCIEDFILSEHDSLVDVIETLAYDTIGAPLKTLFGLSVTENVTIKATL